MEVSQNAVLDEVVHTSKYLSIHPVIVQMTTF